MSAGWIAVRAIALSLDGMGDCASIRSAEERIYMCIAASERDRLSVHGFTGTPEEIERQWYEQVYRGRGDSMRQLTWRAVMMGSVLGGVPSLTNLYIGLKAGWGFGVAITACILSYAIWTTLHRRSSRTTACSRRRAPLATPRAARSS